MRANFVRRTTTVYFTVQGQIEMVADITEAVVTDMITVAILKAQAHVLRVAMNSKYSKRAHNYLQTPRPKAPAMAMAAVIITLRTMPYTNLDFLSSFIMLGN